jgi:hypothetical protein
MPLARNIDRRCDGTSAPSAQRFDAKRSKIKELSCVAEIGRPAHSGFAGQALIGRHVLGYGLDEMKAGVMRQQLCRDDVLCGDCLVCGIRND